MRRRLPSAALLTWLAASGCIVEAPGGEGPARRTTSAVPRAPAHPLSVRSGARFAGKVELVGVTVAPGAVRPGDSARVLLYFKVLAPIPRDHLIFVHVEDPTGRMERFNVDHAPLAGARPTSTWKAGETLTDEFLLTVPEGTQTRMLNLWVGFWQADTDARLPLSEPAASRHDGHDRLLAVQLPVSYD